ncbi:hypothetical protein HDU81_000112 [Chytriomyces hyalinus]|nr:hypothetical protein HDU81_000112 [Chytriomyces hyalinus]
MQERDDTIQDKEKRIYDLKKKNQELEKFKFVLDYKIAELKKQVEPREKDIVLLSTQIKEMDDELHQYQKTHDVLDTQIQDLLLKLRATQRDAFEENGRVHDMKTVVHRIQNDTRAIYKLLENKAALKRNLMIVFHKFSETSEEPEPAEIKARTVDAKQASSDDKGLSGGKQQAEALEEEIEEARQREHLERTASTLRHKLRKDEESRYAENLRIMHENVLLLTEINILRKDFQASKIRTQRLLGAVKRSDIDIRADSEAALEDAVKGFRADSHNLLNSLPSSTHPNTLSNTLANSRPNSRLSPKSKPQRMSYSDALLAGHVSFKTPPLQAHPMRSRESPSHNLNSFASANTANAAEVEAPWSPFESSVRDSSGRNNHANADLNDLSHQMRVPSITSPQSIRDSPTNFAVDSIFALDILSRCLAEVTRECRQRSSFQFKLKVRQMLRDCLAELEDTRPPTPPPGLFNAFQPIPSNLWTSYSAEFYAEGSAGSFAAPLERSFLLPSFLTGTNLEHQSVFSRMSSSLTVGSELSGISINYGNSGMADFFSAEPTGQTENLQPATVHLPVWDRSIPLSSRLDLSRKGFEVPLRLLSPPIRKPATMDGLELKQIKARALRESFLHDRTIKLRQKAEKVMAVRQNQMNQAKHLKESINEKQARAEKQRDMHLRNIQEKAKDEKLRDLVPTTISNTVETKKIEIVAQRHLDSELRLQEIEEDRQKKQAETASHQEAALERRRMQEAERQAKLLRDEERKRDVEAKRELERQEQVAAKEAARLAKIQRRAELKSMKEAEIEEMRRELSEKFQLKLDKWTTRYNESLKKKRDRAAMANQNARTIAASAKQSHVVPSSESYGNLLLLAAGEESKPSEREKGIKRRVKKLKKRLRDASANYAFIPSSACLPNPEKIMLTAKAQLSNLIRMNTAPSNCEQLRNLLFDLFLNLEKGDNLNAESFCNMGGLSVLFNALMLLDGDGAMLLPTSALEIGLRAVLAAAKSPVNREYLLLSMDICIEELAELFVRILSLHEHGDLAWLNLACHSIRLLNLLLEDDGLVLRKAKANFLSYILSIKSIDFLCSYFPMVRGPVTESEGPVIKLLMGGILFLKTISLCHKLDSSLHSLILESFQKADVGSVITMLVSLVLHNGLTSRTAALEQQVSIETIQFTVAGLSMINTLCGLNLHMMQELLSSEGMQPQILHLSMFWFHHYFQWNTSKSSKSAEADANAACSALVQQLLVLLGNACWKNASNQALLRFGQAGLILLRLILALPFDYFVDARLKRILFPALLSACIGDGANLAIVKEEMSLDMMSHWMLEDKQVGQVDEWMYSFSVSELREMVVVCIGGFKV